MNIIIVKYNNPEVEERCLSSVRQYTDLTKHTLTVFDNYGPKKNLGALWNELIEASTDENICLLNSDTVVEDGWTRLEETLDKTNCGAVGPVTNCAGSIQSRLTKDDVVERTNDLSGFCMLFRKSVWREVGKFPEDMPFYGQESIFNRKLSRRGYEFYVDRRVFIYHAGASSYNKAKLAGEAKDDERKFGAWHFYNFVARQKQLEQIIPKDFRIAIVGGGLGNPFPLFKGTEQFINDFFGDRGLILREDLDNRKTLEDFKPNLLVSLQTNFRQSLFDDMAWAKSKGIKTALYFNDLRCPEHPEWPTPYPFPLDPFYDYAFIGNNAFINDWKEKLKVPEVFYLPQGSIQHPKPQTHGRYFKHIHIGGYKTGCSKVFHQNRKEMFDQLADLGIEHLNVAGDGEVRRDERIALQEESYGMYRKADFSWAISAPVSMYTSDRLYTILGAGGCAISFQPGGLDKVFEQAHHLYWFSDVEQARHLVATSSPQQREEIKDRAFTHAQAHHLYKDRMINMLTNIYTEDKSYHGLLSNLQHRGK